MKDTVCLVIFTLNEINGMKAVMPKIQKDWYDQLLVVDGGSTDGTIEYVKEQGLYLVSQKEKGFGAAFSEAMEKVSSDIVVTFSPDGNSLPERIPGLVHKMQEGYDIVIASRYLDGAKSYDDDAITSFGNSMFTGLINLLFGSKYTDSLVMYRAFRRELVEKLKVETKTPCWGTLMLLRATKKKLKVAEIPADEPQRIGGRRKMKPLVNGSYELLTIIKEFLRRD